MNASQHLEVLDVSVVGSTIPSLPSPFISRANLIDTMRSMFDSVVNTVVVSAAPGFGTTTLLAEVLHEQIANSIGFFSKPGSNWLIDSDFILSEIGAQMTYLVDGAPKDIDGPISHSELLRCIRGLQQRYRRTGKHTYFVLDNLHLVLADGRNQDAEISKLLPFGLDGFRFVIANGHATELTNLLPSAATWREFSIPYLNDSEAKALLGELELGQDELLEIVRTFKGHPQSLLAVRRILEKSDDKLSTIADLSTSTFDILDYEWTRLPLTESYSETVLALIAFDHTYRTIEEISTILDVSLDEIAKTVGILSVLSIAENGRVSYVSETMRKFARTKLNPLHHMIVSQLIEYLLFQNTPESAIQLPDYFAEGGRFDQLVDYLSAETLDKMSLSVTSLSQMKHIVARGLEAAKRTQNDKETIRLGSILSAINSIRGSESLELEIVARTIHGDVETAIELANNRPYTEEKLRFSAIVGRTLVEEGRKLPDVLLENIENLARTIDRSISRQQLIEIGVDVFFSLPEIGIRLLDASREKQATVTPHDPTSFNRSLLPSSSTSDEERIGNALYSTRDDDIPRLTLLLSGAVPHFSAQRVLSEAAGVGNSADQIGLLRTWCLNNPNDEDADQVILRVIDLIIESPEYAPTARTFRDITAPLPRLAAIRPLNELLVKLSRQVETTWELGPFEDYIKAQMNLVSAEQLTVQNGGRDRYARTLTLVAKHPEPEGRFTSLCALYLAATETPGLASEATKKELIRSIEDLFLTILDDCSDQVRSTRAGFGYLAQCDVSLALGLTSMLNTSARRDSACVEMMRSVVIEPLIQTAWYKLRDIASHLSQEVILENVILRITREYRDHARQQAQKWEFDNPEPILNLLGYMRSPDLLLVAKSNVLAGASHIGVTLQCHQFLRELESDIFGHKNLEMDPHEKRTALLRAAVGLSSAKPELSKTLLRDVDEIPALEELTPSLSHSSYLLLKLGIRGLRGVFAQEAPPNLLEWIDAIRDIEYPSLRCSLLSELLIAASCSSDSTIIGLSAIGSYLLDEYDAFKTSDPVSSDRLFPHIAPGLYLANQTIFLGREELRTSPFRDVSLLNVVRSRLTKSPVDEPKRTIGSPGPDFEAVRECLTLVERISEDNILVSAFMVIADEVRPLERGTFYTQQQCSEVSRAILDVAIRKLPDPKNIQHDGYLIWAKGIAFRVESNRNTDWSSLFDSASGIKHRSDKAFVLAMLLEQIAKKTKQWSTFTEMAFQSVSQIESSFERVDRWCVLADSTLRIDRAFGQRCLVEANKVTIELDSEEVESRQRRIVDLAYRIDPELASTFASQSDTDSARQRVREKRLEQRIALMKLQTEIADPKRRRSTGDAKLELLPEVFWGLLESLNRGEINPTSVGENLPWLIQGSYLEVTEFYPIASWSMESSVVKYRNSHDISKYVLPASRSFLLAARAITSMDFRRLAARRKSVALMSNLEPSRKLIKAGERHLAIEYLREWIRENCFEILKICDPYFGPDDLEILKLVQEVSPFCRVLVLTDAVNLKKAAGEVPSSELFEDRWNAISSQPPPDFELVAVRLPHSTFPIHDRWWITDSSGLSIGTSLNGLGRQRDSEISTLDAASRMEREEIIDRLLIQRPREIGGHRASYNIITMA